MATTARNFHAHGGSEWVIGGKLTFLPGATVEGAEDLLGLPAGKGNTVPCIRDSVAGTVAALREDFNGLLAVLRAAGILAAEEQTGDAT